MSELENQDNSSIEDYLTPPKYDATWFLMIVLASIIVWVVSGIVIILFAYVSIGKFSLESGVSPILLAMITFFGLIIGNILYYILLSKIFPEIYTRGRTALSQVALMSIVLYVFFAPAYLVISTLSVEPSVILLAFSLHVLMNTFCLHLVIGLTAQYRYSLLVLYANVASLLLTATLMSVAYVSLSTSSNALFLLLGLVIIAQTMGSFVTYIIFWIYGQMYKATGYDPIGSVFGRIESEEKELEKQATDSLTRFHS